MKMKNWMRSAGFTLVELIVVIAVLGILGAGAAVGYSGYVKKANKAADEALVAQIKYALEVAQVSDPMPDGAAAVVLSQTGAAVTGTTDADNPSATTWVTNAMTDAFGANWENELKLQYGEWGKGAVMTKKSLENFLKWGTDEDRTKALAALVKTGDDQAIPSFANDVDDLYDLIEKTAKDVGGTLRTSGAQLIQDAANLTATSTALSSADAFATAWASQVWDSDMFMGDGKGNTYNKDGIDEAKKDTNDDENAKFLANAVANAGVIKARNTSIAIYLRNNGVDQRICDYFENYSFGNSFIPMDTMSDQQFAANLQAMMTEKGISGSASDILVNKVFPYMGITYDAATGAATLPGGEQAKATQAYKDGLAYYAMMDTINAVKEDGQDDDTYWDNMRSAVSAYGKIASGKTTLTDMEKVTENAAEGSVFVFSLSGGAVYSSID